MRSIAVATVWEFWRRTWAPLAMVLSIGVGLPALVFSVLPALFFNFDSMTAVDDPTLLRFQFIFYIFDLFILCCVLCGVQALGPGLATGKPRRLYQLPMTTASLVAGQLLCGMAAMALTYLAIVAALNVLFPLNWPLWEPALMAAAIYACVQAALWLPTSLRLVQLIVLTAVSTPLFFWVKSKFGPMWDDVQHGWYPFPAGEVATLLGLIVAAYLLAVWSVGRDRSGRVQTWFAWREWLDRPTAVGGRGFRSPQQAQFWYEWRQKGWIMPALLLFFMLVLLVGYQFGGSQRTDLVNAFRAYGMALVVFSLVVSLVQGSARLSAEGRGECGPFLGTRPLTDAALSAAMLEVSAVSLLVTWLLWIAGTAAATCWLGAGEGLSAVRHAWQLLPNVEGPSWVLYFLGVLFMAWTVLATFVPLTMTGRHRLVFSVLTFGPVAFAAFLWSVKVGLVTEAAEFVMRAAAYLASTALLIGIAVAVRTALRSGHITPRTVGLGLALWVVPCVLFVTIYGSTQLGHPVVLTMIITAWAASLSPLATAPLAMSWNRHR